MASEAANNAVLRMMLRQAAPNIRKTLEAAGEQWNEPVYMLYMVMGHETKENYEDPKNSFIMIRSIANPDKMIRSSGADPNATQETKENLDVYFPVASAIIAEHAAEWGLTQINVLLYFRLINGRDLEKVDSIELKIKERRRKDPAGNYLPQRELILSA